MSNDFIYDVYLNNELIGSTNNKQEFFYNYMKHNNYYNRCLDIEPNIKFEIVDWPGRELLDIIRT